MIVELEGIEKVYRAGKASVPALRGINLAVAEGEFVSVMGPSGSGKSTLLNILGCLDRPTKGRYLLHGKPVDGLSDQQLARLRNRHLGFVFQNFQLLPRLSARRNVELPLIYRGLPSHERRKIASEALAAVGISPQEMNRFPAELSGGQQQRVAIARAIVGRPLLILADEPTGNLDRKTGEEIMALFQSLNRDLGMTIIQVTHDEHMARHGRRVVRLLDGAVVGDERVDEPVDAREALKEMKMQRDGEEG